MSKYSKILFALTLFTLIFGFGAKRANSHELIAKPAIFKLTPNVVEYPTSMSSVEAQLEQLNRQACPAYGRISSTFGYRNSPGGVGSTNHKGLDIANIQGSPIYAYKAGIIVEAEYQGGYGNVVKIDHGDGTMTLYGHNSRLMVNVGDHVETGAQIAAMGSTGHSTGSHSHWEVIVDGVKVDPYTFYLEVC